LIALGSLDLGEPSCAISAVKEPAALFVAAGLNAPARDRRAVAYRSAETRQSSAADLKPLKRCGKFA
jgi:hypothetical protein